MEQFAVSHGGGLSVHHDLTINLSNSFVQLAKEVRYAVLILTVGWVVVTGIRTLEPRDKRTPGDCPRRSSGAEKEQ